MMDFRRRVAALLTVIGVLVVLLIVGAVLTLQARGLAPTVRLAFPSLRPNEVSNITIGQVDNSEASKPATLDLSRGPDGKWQVISNGTTRPADSAEVRNLLSDLSTLHTTRTVTNNKSLYKEFQLDPAHAHLVTITMAKGPKLKLYYGKDAVGGGYVRIGNDPAVYLADHSLGYYMSRSADNWYDLRLFPETLHYGDIQEITVSFLPGISSVQKGLVVLQGKKDPRLPATIRTQGYRLVRRSTDSSPNTWFFEGDLAISLDQPQVESVSREFATLQGSSFATGSSLGGKFGVDHPGIRVQGTTADGSTYTLKIGNTAGKDTFYVQPEGPGVSKDRNGKPFVYVISRWYLQRVLKPIDDLEKKAKRAVAH